MTKSLYTKKAVKILISFLLMLVIFFIPVESNLKSQTSDPNIITTLNIFPVDVYYISETFFDFRDVRDLVHSSIIFISTISSDQDTEVYLEFEFFADIQNSPQQTRLYLYRARTQPISLTAGLTNVYTNRDLGKGGNLPLEQSEYIDLNDSRAKRIVEIIRATGKLPDGDYTIRKTLYLTTAPNVPYGIPIERTITIFNPTRVDLLSPMDGETIFSTIPLFQWRSDTRRSRLHIYEWNPLIQSKEEAITGIPHLVRDFDFFQNQFIYPAEGARVLEPGKQYVYYVTGLVHTSAGEEEILSEIYSFRVADQAIEATLSTLLQLLRSMLGTDYEHIFNAIEDGEFEITDYIQLDGTLLTPTELINVINNIFAGLNNAQILDLRLEQ